MTESTHDFVKYKTAFDEVINRWQQNNPQSGQNSSNAGSQQNGKKNYHWKNAISDILNWLKP